MDKGTQEVRVLRYVRRTRTPYSRFMYMETSKKLLLIVSMFWMITVMFAIYAGMYLRVDLTPVLSYVSTAFMVEVTAYSAKAGYEKKFQYPDYNVEQYVPDTIREINNIDTTNTTTNIETQVNTNTTLTNEEVPIDTATIDKIKR